MKQIIPFKQELLFKTKVSEITSISLEHNIISKTEDKITGNFIVSGDYKMTEGSINREKFDFNIPFEINLDDKYDIDSVTIDIDNFYYEIVNNEILKVNIDIFLIGESLKEVFNVKDEIVKSESREEDDINYDNLVSIKYDKSNIVKNIDDDNVIDKSGFDKNVDDNNIIDKSGFDKNVDDNIDSSNITNNIFGTLDSSDTYVTYYVYMVKEDDNIEKILNKFNVNREELEKYNDITNIKERDKLIIPYIFNE